MDDHEAEAEAHGAILVVAGLRTLGLLGCSFQNFIGAARLLLCARGHVEGRVEVFLQQLVVLGSFGNRVIVNTDVIRIPAYGNRAFIVPASRH